MSVKREPAIRKTHPAELIPERPAQGRHDPCGTCSYVTIAFSGSQCPQR